MGTVAVPLLIGVGGAHYLTGAASDSLLWDWAVTGLTPITWDYQQMVGSWRVWATTSFGGPPTHDEWRTATAPDSADGFVEGTASAEQVTDLPVFRGPFTSADGNQHGLGGAVSVRSLGFLAPHTVPATAGDPRLRVEYTCHTGEGLSSSTSLVRTGPDSTFEPQDADSSTGWTYLSNMSDAGLTTTTVEHRYGSADDDPTDGYLDHLMTFRAHDAPTSSGYRLRLTSVRMWACYDVAGGAWRLRQRQTLAGADSWPLRQRQSGHQSGSWPLRQRQNGI